MRGSGFGGLLCCPLMAHLTSNFHRGTRVAFQSARRGERAGRVSFLICQQLVISYCFDNVHSNALLTTHTSRIVRDSSQTAPRRINNLKPRLETFAPFREMGLSISISMRLVRLLSIYKWRNGIVLERSGVAWNVEHSLALHSDEHKELHLWCQRQFLHTAQRRC